MAANVTPGLSVAIVRGSEVVYAKGFGFADRELGRRATADTQFYIASTTKSFTALAAALLDARGELSLDEPLSQALTRARFHPDINPARLLARPPHSHSRPEVGRRGRLPDRLQRRVHQRRTLRPRAVSRSRDHWPCVRLQQFCGYNIYAMALDQKSSQGGRKCCNAKCSTRWRCAGLRPTCPRAIRRASPTLRTPHRRTGTGDLCKTGCKHAGGRGAPEHRKRPGAPSDCPSEWWTDWWPDKFCPRRP